MLYLAEVKIQKGGVFGGTKAQLKLLACQRSEQSWTAVPGEDVIDADEANKFENGVLVLVELSANKQIQRPPQEAARQLVNILQNFSRLQDKLKTQEEEIEQWKQSLTYQSQELNRREEELQAVEEEMSQAQGELQLLEKTRTEIESAQQEVARLQEELTLKQQQIDSSWQEIQSERQRLDEQSQQSASAVDPEQFQYMNQLIEHLSGAIAPTDAVREQINGGFERVSSSQSTLDEHWHRLSQLRTELENLQTAAQQSGHQLTERKQEYSSVSSSLEQARLQLQVQQNLLTVKQDYAKGLLMRLQAQETLHNTITRLASGGSSGGAKVDIEALERMPLEELQTVVSQLQQALDKDIPFVNDQQEELRMQRETLQELQTKLTQVSDSERGSIEEELADEQDRYEMLNKTVEGQLRIIEERRDVLTQHQEVLARRLGKPMSSAADMGFDLQPILTSSSLVRQQMSEELQALEREIEGLRPTLQEAEAKVQQQQAEQERLQGELDRLEDEVISARATAAEGSGKVSLYEELLQPVQERLNEVRTSLEGAQAHLNHVQETADYQLQLIAQMRQFIQGLIGEGAT